MRANDKPFHAKLEMDFAPALSLVSMVGADVGRLQLNLFSNAFHAVQQRQKANGHTRYGHTRYGHTRYEPTVHVSTQQVGPQVEIRVLDNGIGMSAAVQAKIFQPFFTTKPIGEGTGLGRSLSHDIIAQDHCGTLSVESREGQGTTFSVALPLNEAAH